RDAVVVALEQVEAVGAGVVRDAVVLDLVVARAGQGDAVEGGGVEDVVVLRLDVPGVHEVDAGVAGVVFRAVVADLDAVAARRGDDALDQDAVLVAEDVVLRHHDAAGVGVVAAEGGVVDDVDAGRLRPRAAGPGVVAADGVLLDAGAGVVA